MERKWVIVAFGDIRGFMTWTRRGVNTPEIQDPFVHEFYKALEDFVQKNHAHFKYLGDGMMILKELPEKGHRCMAVREFLRELVPLIKRIQRAINDCAWPQPEGFRLRVVSGHVSKLTVLDAEDDERKRLGSQYIGYAINLAERLLEVRPETVCICHESVVKILGAKKNGFKFKKMAGAPERRKGVDSEDLDALWNLQL